MSRKSAWQQMLAEKEAWGRICSNAAWDCASQLMFDAMSCVLTDPDVMHERTLTIDELHTLNVRIRDFCNYFGKCFKADPERDYYEEVLDRRVRAVYGPETVPFRVRYPALKGHDYTTAPNFAK